MKEHAVIIVPGLGDEVLPLRIAVALWEKKYGLTPIIFPIHWKNLREGYEVKFKRLLHVITNARKKHKKISLVGYSAGGSAVVTAYITQIESIYRVVSVCGRLEKGKNVFPTLKEASTLSPAFSQSVLRAENGIAKLTSAQKKRILTITSRYGDNIVPVSTALIPGVVNRTVPIYGHIPSIAYAFLFPRMIVDFLLGE